MKPDIKLIASIVLAGALSSVAARSEAPPACDFVFVGDSITFGDKLSDPSTQAPPVQCTQSLAARFKVAARVSNQGHCGHTTADWLPSSPSGDFPQAIAAAAALESQQPGQLVFSIMLGTNDSFKGPGSPANYRRNLQTIIDGFLARYPDAFVFVQRPIWFAPSAPDHILALARLQGYFPEIDRLVSDDAAAHPGHVFAGDQKAFDHFSKSYLAELTPELRKDGKTYYVHPNRAGAVVLGKYWADAIAAALRFKARDSMAGMAK